MLYEPCLKGVFPMVCMANSVCILSTLYCVHVCTKSSEVEGQPVVVVHGAIALRSHDGRAFPQLIV